MWCRWSSGNVYDVGGGDVDLYGSGFDVCYDDDNVGCSDADLRVWSANVGVGDTDIGEPDFIWLPQPRSR